MASQSSQADAQCDVFIPAIVDSPERTAGRVRGFNWLVVAAVGTWLVSALWPVSKIVAGEFPFPPAALYLTAFGLYGAALMLILWLPGRPSRFGVTLPIALAAVETVTAIAANMLTIRHINGSGVGIGLLGIVAAQLPYFLSARVTWIWITMQTLVMIGYFLPDNEVQALTFGGATAGFEIFAAAASMLAINEGRARSNLARANAELTATRELLAESSRTAERLRISRDLHDTLGHHLTALSLQLDVAARLSEAKAAEHIQQAHAITRLLLADVRDVVSSLRQTSRLDLVAAVRALAVQPAGARIHLDLPETLPLEDGDRAEVILHAVQEVITNTTRHAEAANLWIRLARRADGIDLQARDDGRGATALAFGNGLRGMRERFQAYGGRVEVETGSERGFEVRAFMPTIISA
jgi:signal transduction histidine kinase